MTKVLSLSLLSLLPPNLVNHPIYIYFDSFDSFDFLILILIRQQRISTNTKTKTKTNTSTLTPIAILLQSRIDPLVVF